MTKHITYKNKDTDWAYTKTNKEPDWEYTKQKSHMWNEHTPK
jgi:hypothetical protein